jgi:4-amino-4-deoxy-L-arabinose transferase-like glycosyltransferase
VSPIAPPATDAAAAGTAASALTAAERFVLRHYPVCALLVLAVMACNVFLGLGTSSVNDFEEARYGVTAFEMQQHHAFVMTTYGGEKELWALKPPLGYWLMALSFALFGGSAWAMRLPSALATLAVVALTMRQAKRWFEPRLAIVAGAIVATTYGFLSHHGARSGDFDASLTLILLLVAVGLPGLRDSPWRVVGLALLLACGFLLKSFAIVPMVLVVAVYAWWTGAWRRQSPAACLVAASVFAAVVGAWAAARWMADGSPDFLVRMLREDVLQRSTSIVDKSTSSPLGYVLALWDRFAPWPLLMVAAVGVVGRAGLWQRLRRDPVLALLALWAAVPLAVVSLVRTQHHWYLDPIYPALAMLAAGGSLLLVGRSPARFRKLATVGLVALPLALCEARVLGRVLVREPMDANQRFLAALRPSAEGCRELRSTGKLAYSERFILQVMDGFAVTEAPRTRPAPAAASVAAPGCVLVEKSAWRRAPEWPDGRLPAHGLLLAENDSYALYGKLTGSGAVSAISLLTSTPPR